MKRFNYQYKTSKNQPKVITVNPLSTVIDKRRSFIRLDKALILLIEAQQWTRSWIFHYGCMLIYCKCHLFIIYGPKYSPPFLVGAWAFCQRTVHLKTPFLIKKWPIPALFAFIFIIFNQLCKNKHNKYHIMGRLDGWMGALV